MSENENSFGKLRCLLTLKRHETPPPGYFDRFSGQVMQRIRSGEAQPSASLMDELFGQAPWLARVLQAFSVKPVFAGGFAGALCLLLFFGIVYAERPDITPEPLLQTETTTPIAALSPASLSPASESVGIVSSTNPVLSLQAVASTSNFGQQNPLAQPVSFQIPGN
jgi:hypothetical protein